MTVYTEIFGGGTVYPAEPTYLSLTFSSNVILQWPIEQAVDGDDIAAKIIDLHPSGAGLSVSFGDARQVSTGYTATFANRETDTVTIKDQGGNTILTVASGLVWTTYLSDNSTANGTWRTFQQGASTSSATAASLAGAGLKAISTTLNTKMAPTTQAVDYSIVNADRATVQQWTGGTGTFTLPDPATVGSDWYVGIKNAGTGSLTLSPSAGTIDGSGSLILATDDSTFIYSDGSNLFTVGFGQEVNSVFDFIQINVAGTGDFTLSGSQVNRIAYRFTGLLTGNRNIIVPASVQQYWVDNETTGAFTLTVKTLAGAGVTIEQGNRSILYCDGTDVVNAETVLVSTPVTVVQGGTGLTSISQGDLIYGSASNVFSALAKDAVGTKYLSNTGASNNPAWAALSGAAITYPLTPQDGEKITLGTGSRFDIYATVGGDLFIEQDSGAGVNAILIGSIAGVGPAITVGNFGGTRNVGLSRPYVTTTTGTVGAGALNLGNGTDTTATGGAATLPGNPVGFLVWNLSGTTIKIPYYAA